MTRISLRDPFWSKFRSPSCGVFLCSVNTWRYKSGEGEAEMAALHEHFDGDVGKSGTT